MIQSRNFRARVLVLLCAGLALGACAHTANPEQEPKTSAASPCEPHPLMTTLEDFRNDVCACKDYDCIAGAGKAYATATRRVKMLECPVEPDDLQGIPQVTKELDRCIRSLVAQQR